MHDGLPAALLYQPTGQTAHCSRVAHAPTEATRSCRAHGMCQRSLPYKFFMLARPELVLWQALLAHAEPALQLVQAGIRIAARATEKERTGQDVSTSPGKTQMPWSRTQA